MSQQGKELGLSTRRDLPEPRHRSPTKRPAAMPNGHAIMIQPGRSNSTPSVTTVSSRANLVSARSELHEVELGAPRGTASRRLCLPAGLGMRLWMAVVCLCVLYNLWLIIARTAFVKLQRTVQTVWFFLDYTADAVYVTDMVLSVVITSGRQGRYCLSWRFIVDLISVVPQDFFYFQVGIKPALRLNRLFKCHRLYTFYQLMKSRVEAVDLWRLLVLIHNVLLILHWNASLYFLVSDSTTDQSTGDNSWSYPMADVGYESLTRQYVYSFYWSTSTLLGLGHSVGCNTPETNAQFAFSALQCVLSVGLLAVIIGYVTVWIYHRWSYEYIVQQSLENTRKYMKDKNVPQESKDRAQDWFDYAWSRGNTTGNASEVLSLLPRSLQQELAKPITVNVLRKIFVFRDLDLWILNDLVLRLKTVTFLPDDIVVKSGSAGQEFFIVSKGQLQVLKDKSVPIGTLNKGSHYGELNLLSNPIETVDIISTGFSEILSLTREDLYSAVKHHSELKDMGSKVGDDSKRSSGLPLTRVDSTGSRASSGWDGGNQVEVDVDVHSGRQTLKSASSDVPAIVVSGPDTEMPQPPVSYTNNPPTAAADFQHMLESQIHLLHGTVQALANETATQSREIWQLRNKMHHHHHHHHAMPGVKEDMEMTEIKRLDSTTARTLTDKL